MIASVICAFMTSAKFVLAVPNSIRSYRSARMLYSVRMTFFLTSVSPRSGYETVTVSHSETFCNAAKFSYPAVCHNCANSTVIFSFGSFASVLSRYFLARFRTCSIVGCSWNSPDKSSGTAIISVTPFNAT